MDLMPILTASVDVMGAQENSAGKNRHQLIAAMERRQSHMNEFNRPPTQVLPSKPFVAYSNPDKKPARKLSDVIDTTRISSYSKEGNLVVLYNKAEKP